jgi:hypothetical protein
MKFTWPPVADGVFAQETAAKRVSTLKIVFKRFIVNGF